MYKILRVVWDNSSRYSNISDDLRHKMLTATKVSIGQFCDEWEVDNIKIISDPEWFFITSDLNDIIKKFNKLDYTHVIVFSIGLVLEDTRNFIEGLRKPLEENSKVVGHILHHGIKNNTNFFTLHDQTLLLSKEAVNSLEKDNFVFNNSIKYQTDNWITIARTEENFHDNYTPLQIWKDESNQIIPIKKNSDDGFGEDLIQYSIKNNWKVENFNTMVRGAKRYSYYYENPQGFEYYLNQPLDVVIKDKQKMLLSHFEFLAEMKRYQKIGDHSKWYAYNNEKIFTGMPKKTYDTFIGPASGFLPWLYLVHYNFKDNSTVLLTDINDIALDFQRWFLENYDPTQNATWQDWIESYEKVNIKIEKSWSERFKSKNNDIWKEFKPFIDSKWNQIKKYNFTFKCTSMISYETENLIDEFLKKSKDPMVWLSNIFTFDGVYFNNNKPFEVFLADMFSSNPHVIWAGFSPYGVSRPSLGPNSHKESNDLYCEEIMLPKFDINEFLKEIENLEKHDLFVKHRSDKHPGWSSFVLHGIDWNKTNDYGDYGYASNEETPYKFVDYAKQHIPTIVKYFQNNQINNFKKYHRIRIMKLAPGGYISLHNDTPDGKYHTNGWNLNMAINNPENCEMHFWNDKYLYLGQVPWQPGKAFKIRTGYNHLVRNLSNENRYHIIVHGE